MSDCESTLEQPSPSFPRFLPDERSALGSPDTSVSSSTPASSAAAAPSSASGSKPTSVKEETGEAEVTSTSLSGPGATWSLEAALGDKNPFSALSEEDIIRIQSVLSTEEGKKILQQTSLPGMETSQQQQQQDAMVTDKGNSATMAADKSDGVAIDTSVIGDVDIPLELDEETATQFLKEGIRESYLVDFAVSFSDHAYSAASTVPPGECSAEPVDPQSENLVKADQVGEVLVKEEDGVREVTDSEAREETGAATNTTRTNRQPIIRRSTRIQDQEQREMAEKIRQENIQREKEALSQNEDEKKVSQKQYNMRTKRPQREDGRIDYTQSRRGRCPESGQAEAGEPEEEEEEEARDPGDEGEGQEDLEGMSHTDVSDGELQASPDQGLMLDTPPHYLDPETSGNDTKSCASTPRRSARPPKKKSWLIELEKERDSKEESGRDVRDQETQDGSDSDGESEGQNDTSDNSNTEKAEDVTVRPGRGRRGARGRSRGAPRGRGRGRGRGVKKSRDIQSRVSDSDSSGEDLPLMVLQKQSTRGRGRGRGSRGRGSGRGRGRKAARSDREHQEEGEVKSEDEPRHDTDSDEDKPLTTFKIKIPEMTKARRRKSSSSQKELLSPERKISTQSSREGKKPHRRQRRRVRGRKDREDDEDQGSETSSLEHTAGASSGDVDSEDDPGRLWCVCRKPYNNRFMISCDGCKEWYHGSCVGVTRKQGKEIDRRKDHWSCPVCLKMPERSISRIHSKTPVSSDQEQPEPVTIGTKPSTNSDVAMETDEDSELVIAFSEDEEKQRSVAKLHISKLERAPKPSRRVSHMNDSAQGARSGHEGQNVSPHTHSQEDVMQGEQEEEEAAVDSDDGDTWIVRKKDSEKKLEDMQKKLKALKAKKDRKEGHERKPSGVEKAGADSKKKHLHKPASEEERRRPKDFSPLSLKGRCTRSVCTKPVMSGSMYCSEDCIAKYSVESLEQLKQERHRVYGSKQAEGSTERIVVMERKTGKILTGPAAPTAATLHPWLEKHPMFEVMLPEQHSSSVKKKEEPKKKPEVKLESSKDKRSATNSSSKDRSRDKSAESSSKRSSAESSREKSSKEQDKLRREKREREREKGHKYGQEKKKEELSPPVPSGPNPVRISVRKALKDYLTGRADNADDVMLSASEIKRVAVDIEEELYKLYGDVNSKYKHKFKYILINIKDSKNKGFFRKILNLEISPKSLVRMSSESLGSKEMAKWVDRDHKQELAFLGVVADSPVRPSGTGYERSGAAYERGEPLSPLLSPPVTVATLPRIPKKQPSTDERKSRYEDSGPDFFSSFIVDSTPQHKNHLFDVNCKICTGKESNPDDSTNDTGKKVKFNSTVNTKSITPEKVGVRSLMDLNFKNFDAVKPGRSEEAGEGVLEGADSPGDAMVIDDALSYDIPAATPPVPVDKPLLPAIKSLSSKDAATSHFKPAPVTTVTRTAELYPSGSQTPGPSRSHSYSAQPAVSEAPKQQSYAPDSRLQESYPPESQPSGSHTPESQPAGSHTQPDQRSPTPHRGTQARAPRPAVHGPSRPAPSAHSVVRSEPLKQDPRSTDSGTDVAGAPGLSAHQAAPSSKPLKLPPDFSGFWRGYLFAQDLSKFPTSAYSVSGNVDGLKEDLPETISVMGRLPPENVYDYLSRLKGSHTSNREICVLRFQPTGDDEKASYVQLFNYLNGRSRCGVVGALGRVIKDVYIVPLPSQASIPPVLLPFDGPGLPVPRPHLLLCIIVKAKPRRHHGDGHANKPPSKTWMYTERPPGETVKLEVKGQTTLDVKPVTGKSSVPAAQVPAPTAVPRVVPVPGMVPVPTSVPRVVQASVPTASPLAASSQEATSVKSSERSSSASEDEADYTEGHLNDPIIKQYAKADPAKLATEPGPGAVPYEPPEDEPYDPFTVYGEEDSPDENDGPSFTDPKMVTSTTSVPQMVPPPDQTYSIGLPASSEPSLGSAHPISKVLDEISRSRNSTQMTAAMLATIAATSSSRSIEEQRKLLLELNKKVEEQRQFIEKQKEVASKRSQPTEPTKSQPIPDSTGVNNADKDPEVSVWPSVPPKDSEYTWKTLDPRLRGSGLLTTPSNPLPLPSSGSQSPVTEPVGKESSTDQLSSASSETISTNLARRRLAQKIQMETESSKATTTPQPATASGLDKLPPALQALLTGSSLQNLKDILSKATAGSTDTSTAAPQTSNTENQVDELDAALNEKGGKDVYDQIEDAPYFMDTEESVKDASSSTTIFSSEIPGCDLETSKKSETEDIKPSDKQTSAIPDWAANLPKSSAVEYSRREEADAPPWLDKVKELADAVKRKQAADKITEEKARSNNKRSRSRSPVKRSRSKSPVKPSRSKSPIKPSRSKSPVKRSRSKSPVKRSPRRSKREESHHHKRSPGHSSKSRERNRKKESITSSSNLPSTALDEDLEEGEIREQPPSVTSSSSAIENKTNNIARVLPADGTVDLNEIPLPGQENNLPVLKQTDNSKTQKPDNSGVDVKVNSPNRSRSSDRRRRSRSRSRNVRRRSRSRGRRGRSRSSSRDRYRRSRRSRSRDRRRSRSTSAGRSSRRERERSRDRTYASKRKRSSSRDSSIKRNDKSKPKTPEKRMKLITKDVSESSKETKSSIKVQAPTDSTQIKHKSETSTNKSADNDKTKANTSRHCPVSSQNISSSIGAAEIETEVLLTNKQNPKSDKNVNPQVIAFPGMSSRHQVFPVVDNSPHSLPGPSSRIPGLGLPDMEETPNPEKNASQSLLPPHRKLKLLDSRSTPSPVGSFGLSSHRSTPDRDVPRVPHGSDWRQNDLPPTLVQISPPPVRPLIDLTPADIPFPGLGVKSTSDDLVQNPANIVPAGDKFKNPPVRNRFGLVLHSSVLSDKQQAGPKPKQARPEAEEEYIPLFDSSGRQIDEEPVSTGQPVTRGKRDNIHTLPGPISRTSGFDNYRPEAARFPPTPFSRGPKPDFCPNSGKNREQENLPVPYTRRLPLLPSPTTEAVVGVVNTIRDSIGNDHGSSSRMPFQQAESRHKKPLLGIRPRMTRSQEREEEMTAEDFDSTFRPPKPEPWNHRAENRFSGPGFKRDVAPERDTFRGRFDEPGRSFDSSKPKPRFPPTRENKDFKYDVQMSSIFDHPEPTTSNIRTSRPYNERSCENTSVWDRGPGRGRDRSFGRGERRLNKQDSDKSGHLVDADKKTTKHVTSDRKSSDPKEKKTLPETRPKGSSSKVDQAENKHDEKSMSDSPSSNKGDIKMLKPPQEPKNTPASSVQSETTKFENVDMKAVEPHAKEEKLNKDIPVSMNITKNKQLANPSEKRSDEKVIKKENQSSNQASNNKSDQTKSSDKTNHRSLDTNTRPSEKSSSVSSDTKIQSSDKATIKSADSKIPSSDKDIKSSESKLTPMSDKSEGKRFDEHCKTSSLKNVEQPDKTKVDQLSRQETEQSNRHLGAPLITDHSASKSSAVPISDSENASNPPGQKQSGGKTAMSQSSDKSDKKTSTKTSTDPKRSVRSLSSSSASSASEKPDKNIKPSVREKDSSWTPKPADEKSVKRGLPRSSSEQKGASRYMEPSRSQSGHDKPYARHSGYNRGNLQSTGRQQNRVVPDIADTKPDWKPSSRRPNRSEDVRIGSDDRRSRDWNQTRIDRPFESNRPPLLDRDSYDRPDHWLPRDNIPRTEGHHHGWENTPDMSGEDDEWQQPFEDAPGSELRDVDYRFERKRTPPRTHVNRNQPWQEPEHDGSPLEPPHSSRSFVDRPSTRPQEFDRIISDRFPERNRLINIPPRSHYEDEYDDSISVDYQDVYEDTRYVESRYDKDEAMHEDIRRPILEGRQPYQPPVMMDFNNSGRGTGPSRGRGFPPLLRGGLGPRMSMRPEEWRGHGPRGGHGMARLMAPRGGRGFPR